MRTRLGSGARLAFVPAAFALLVFACDGFGTSSDATNVTTDAGTRDTRDTRDSSDSPETGAEKCDPRGKFVSYTPLRAISATGALDTHPAVTPDELTIYVGRAAIESSTNGRIFTATRKSVTDDFGRATELAELNGYAEAHYLVTPAVSPDGAHLAFATFDYGAPLLLDLAVVDRAAGTTAFNAAPRKLDELNQTATHERSPAFSGDGKRLYFSSNRPDVDAGTAGDTIFVSDIVLGGYGAPRPVTNGAEGLRGFNPVPSPDGSTLYLTRYLANGTVHIFVADLAADGQSVSNVAPIVTPTGSSFRSDTAHESPGSVSTDNCRLYFAIDEQANGDSDIWVASRR